MGAAAASCLVELLLLVGLDGAVAGGVGHAGQHEASRLLAVVQERLVRLVDRAGNDLAGAARAGARAARVGEVQASLLNSARERERREGCAGGFWLGLGSAGGQRAAPKAPLLRRQACKLTGPRCGVGRGGAERQ